MTQEVDPFDLTGQARAQSENDEAKRDRLEREAADFMWLMSDKRGRRIVWRLLESAGVFRLSYAGNAEDTIFREGNRNLGLKLIHDINALCPERYTMMVKEQREYATRRNGSTDTGSTGS